MSRFLIPIVPMIHVKSPTSVFMAVARLPASIVLISTVLGCGILSQLIFRMQFLLFRLKDYYCTIFVAFTSQVVINLVTVWHEMFAAPKVCCVLFLDISLVLGVCCFPWSKIKYYTTVSINEDFFWFACTSYLLIDQIRDSIRVHLIFANWSNSQISRTWSALERFVFYSIHDIVYVTITITNG